MSPAGWLKNLLLISGTQACDTKLTPTESKSHQAFNKAKPHSSWLLSWDLHLPPKPGDCSLQQQFGDKQTADGSGRTEVSILLSLPTTSPPPASLPGRNLLARAQERTRQWCHNHPRAPIPHVTLSHVGFVTPTETQPWKEGKGGGKDMSKGSCRELCLSTQSSPGLSDHQ